jgi:hypothetical protein
MGGEEEDEGCIRRGDSASGEPAAGEGDAGQGQGQENAADGFLPLLLRPLAWQVALKAYEAVRQEMHRLLHRTDSSVSAIGDAPVPATLLTSLLLQIAQSQPQLQHRLHVHVSVLSRRLSVLIADGHSHICIADMVLLLANPPTAQGRN